MTEGSTAQYPERPELIEEKERQARAAAEVMGATTVQFARLPDMALSTLSPPEVNRPIEDMVDSFNPNWVAVHHHGDLNRDHVLVNEAARVATRPGTGVDHIITYETPSSTAWGATPFVPDLYARLDPTDLDTKVAAFLLYETETRPFPHPRSSESLIHLASHRGSECGWELAEAFESVWHRM